ncbi:MAG: 3-oxoacyl-ACP reductase FabG [Chlamydiales bacterium]
MILGKVAIITGGTRGIGQAIAKRFIEEGISVALFATNAERGKQVVEELQPSLKEGQKALFYQVDVGEPNQVKQCVQQVYCDFGQVDILVNNAGVSRDNLLLRLKEEEWEEVININLKSVYNMCREVVRQMLKARSGKIINITSVVGLQGNAGQTNYAASKAGMIGFTKSLAKEISNRNICVNCIAPGFIKTDMTDKLNDKQKEAIQSQIPMRRLGEPVDVANAAVFLASSLADYITGQVLTVDGGMVM